MPSPSRSGWIAGVAAGLIAFGAFAAGAALLGGAGRAPRADRHDPSAAADLVAAYERSGLSTYTIERVFHRRLRTGRELTTTALVVQRPPDRLVRSDESVDGVVGGFEVGCTRAGDDPWQCRRGAPTDYRRAAHADTTTLESLVTGDLETRIYAVTRGGPGCYRLRLVSAVLAPPYGRDAVLCFHAATGAPARSEVRRAEGVDVTTATRIEPDVAAGALVLPAPLRSVEPGQ